jgi:hypothetical protein
VRPGGDGHTSTVWDSTDIRCSILFESTSGTDAPMTTPTETLLRDYPSPVWDSSEEGRCCMCHAKCKRYGIGANPLCRDCFATTAAKWGAGVRQKGYNA